VVQLGGCLLLLYFLRKYKVQWRHEADYVQLHAQYLCCGHVLPAEPFADAASVLHLDARRRWKKSASFTTVAGFDSASESSSGSRQIVIQANAAAGPDTAKLLVNKYLSSYS